MDTVSKMSLRIINPKALQQQQHTKYPQCPINNLHQLPNIFKSKNCIVYVDSTHNKCYKKSKNNKHELNILSEIKNLSHVINPLGIYSQLDNNILYYVIELPLYKMDLFTYIFENLGETTSKTNITENQIIFLIKQILLGLESLHNVEIIHKDIKPENILLDENYNIVITDFGNAESSKYKLNYNYGTEAYIPPEYFKYEIISSKYDIWSCGCILYTMLYSYMIWCSDLDVRCSDVIVNDPIIYYNTRSPNLIKLCKMLLYKDPNQRATTQELLLQINDIERINKSDLLADIQLNLLFCNSVF